MPTRRPPEPVETPLEEAYAEAAAEPTALEQFIDVFHEDWKALPLAAKLAKIGGTLGNIPKKGFNRNQNYRFLRETDLVAAIRPYLAAAGILITFSVNDHEIIERPGDGKSMLTHITVHWRVTDGKETIEGDMPGYGMDPGDKGVYKAITGAKKYILMTLFLIDTGDDPEDEKPQRQITVRPRPALNMDGYGVHDETGQDEMEAPEPVVTSSARTDIVRGGHTTEATDTQRARLIEAIRAREWSSRQFLTFVREELGAGLVDAPEEDPDKLRVYIRAMLDSMTPVDMGQLLVGIERE